MIFPVVGSVGSAMILFFKDLPGETKRRLAVSAAVTMLSALAAPPAAAGLVLGQYDWETPTTNWQTDHGFALLQQIPANGNPGGWLEFVLPATTNGAPDAEQWDIAKTDASSLFAGGWDTSMWVEFDFWSTSAPPPTVQVRWKSASTNYVWAYDVSPSVGDGWSTLRAPLANWDDWNVLDGGGSLEQYLYDLATIDWIGVYVHRVGLGEETYGLDDFSLMVPEPGEFVLLGAAMAVSGLSLRRRRRSKET